MDKLELRKQCQTCQNFDWQLHQLNSFFCAMHPYGQLNCADYEVNSEALRRLKAREKAFRRNQQILKIKIALLSAIILGSLAISLKGIDLLNSISPTSDSDFINLFNISLINQIYLILSSCALPYLLRVLSKEIKWLKKIILAEEQFSEEIAQSIFRILSLASIVFLLIVTLILILSGTYYGIEPASTFIEASWCLCMIPYAFVPVSILYLLDMIQR
ncbi:MAG: hypothetical protein QNJ37_24250 [Crocosphaera sp.]|nr:hypothetical protein [Crocosphaera sp.]